MICITRYSNVRHVKATVDPNYKYRPEDWVLCEGRIRKEDLDEILRLYADIFGKKITRYELVQQSLYLMKKYLLSRKPKQK